jgi:hypothetical protein
MPLLPPHVSRQRLSAPETIFIKWLFPLLWSGGWGIGTIDFFIHPQQVSINHVVQDPPPGFGVLLVVAWFVGTPLALLFGWRLKRVHATPTALYVSNYLREICIPLSEIADVYHPPYSRRAMVVVEFRRRTAFGDRIRFLSREPVSRRTDDIPGMTDLISLIDRAEPTSAAPPGTVR